MRAVNLLPPESFAPKKRVPNASYIFGAMLPVLAGACVFLGWSYEHSKVVDRQNDLGAVEATIAQLRPTQTLRDEASRIGSDRASRETALNAVLANQIPWDVSLGQIARVLPGDVWLTSLTAQSPTPSGSVSTPGTASATASPTGFTIQGYTFSHDSVALLLERLALVPSLSGVTLSSTSSNTVGKTPVIQFNVSAAMNAPAHAVPEAR